MRIVLSSTEEAALVTATGPLDLPYSLIGQTPLNELKHPVMIMLEGENRVLHEFHEAVELMQRMARHNNSGAPQIEALDVFWEDTGRAREWLRARDACARRCPTSFGEITDLASAVEEEAFLCHMGVGRAPLTRKLFTSALLEPVELQFQGETPTAAQTRLLRYKQTVNMLLARAVLDGFGSRARALIDMRGDPTFAPTLGGGDRADSPLIVACRGGDIPMLSTLLQSGTPDERLRWVNHTDKDGTLVPPLVVATGILDLLGETAEAERLLTRLLEARADPNVLDADGFSPLARILHRHAGKPWVARALVVLRKFRASGDSTSEGARAPLDVLASVGDAALARTLLDVFDATVDGVEGRRGGGRTPLMLAVSGHHEGMVQLLLERKADTTLVDMQGSTVFHYAAQFDCGTAMVQSLCAATGHCLTLSAMDNLRGHTPLHSAVYGRHRRSAEALLTQDLALSETWDDTGRAAVHIAAAQGDVPMLKMLLRVAPSTMDAPDCQNRTPLQTAVGLGKSSVVELLLTEGARPVEQWQLLAAAEMGFVRTVRLMVEGGGMPLEQNVLLALIVSQNVHGIYKATGDVPTEDLHALLRREPQLIVMPSADKETPLHAAIAHGQRQTVLTMLRLLKGASKMAAWGCSALHAVARNLDADMFRTLHENAFESVHAHLQAAVDATGITPICAALAAHAMARGYEPKQLVVDDEDDEARAMHLPSIYSAPRSGSAFGAHNDATPLVEAMLNARADPCRVDARGFGAIHYWAASLSVQPRGDCDLLLLLTPLLGGRADPCARSHTGVTPLQIATALGGTQAVHLLQTMANPTHEAVRVQKRRLRA